MSRFWMCTRQRWMRFLQLTRFEWCVQKSVLTSRDMIVLGLFWIPSQAPCLVWKCLVDWRKSRIRISQDFVSHQEWEQHWDFVLKEQSLYSILILLIKKTVSMFLPVQRTWVVERSVWGAQKGSPHQGPQNSSNKCLMVSNKPVCLQNVPTCIWCALCWIRIVMGGHIALAL